MAPRHEVSEAEWARIEPFVPARKTKGTFYRNHRAVLDGMLYRHAIGCPRRDLPERYGPWSTVHSRFRRWTREALSDRILRALQRDLDAAGQIDWRMWCIDGSHVRAHCVAAGAGGKPPSPSRGTHRGGRAADPRQSPATGATATRQSAPGCGATVCVLSSPTAATNSCAVRTGPGASPCSTAPPTRTPPRSA